MESISSINQRHNSRPIVDLWDGLLNLRFMMDFLIDAPIVRWI